MALVKFGNGVAAISGKIAGNVFARNKAGAYARNWAKPTTTPTPIQTAARARFGNQSAGWGALTDTQTDAWAALAATVTRINRLGDPYIPTGRQIYIEVSNNLAVIAGSINADPPADLIPPTISPSLTVPATAIAGVIDSMDLTGTGVDVKKKYVVEASGPVSNVLNNLTNKYRTIGVVAGSATPIDLVALYSAAFSDVLSTGQFVWFRIHCVDVDNGVSSSYLIVKTKVG